MPISICNAAFKSRSLPFRTAVSATFRLVGLRKSNAVSVAFAQVRMSSASFSSEIFLRDATISSTVLCPNAVSRATRFAPISDGGGSSGSRSCEHSSIVSLITSYDGFSKDASRSKSAGMRREGI